jgi:hypothetical protein
VDDAIDPITTVDLVRLEIEAELFAHHTSEEAADRVLPPRCALILLFHSLPWFVADVKRFCH